MVMFWVGFVVVVGLLPILLQAVIKQFRDHGVDWTELLGSGELLLISAVIGGATVGEVVESGRRKQANEFKDFWGKLRQFLKDFAYVISLIVTLLCMIFSIVIYGILVVDKSLSGLNARNWSEVLFVITVVSSAVIIGSVRKL
jgi:hypothetical protein